MIDSYIIDRDRSFEWNREAAKHHYANGEPWILDGDWHACSGATRENDAQAMPMLPNSHREILRNIARYWAIRADRAEEDWKFHKARLTSDLSPRLAEMPPPNWTGRLLDNSREIQAHEVDALEKLAEMAKILRQKAIQATRDYEASLPVRPEQQSKADTELRNRARNVTL